MTAAAEVRKLDDAFEVVPVARLVVAPDGGIDVVELAPQGGAVAEGMLEEPLVDPFGRQVTRADGEGYLLTLRWARSSERLWVTAPEDMPDDEARDPAVPLPERDEPVVAATVPDPEPPPGLADVRVVEVRRPAADDYCRPEVVARLVAEGGDDADYRIEGDHPGVAAEMAALLHAAGRPPLGQLADTLLVPGYLATSVRFDRPGDRAWRDGLVDARRAAAAAGNARAVARLDLEQTTLLPRVWLSRCPLTGEVLRWALDGWALDGPYWDPDDPVRPLDDPVPATFVGVAGTLGEPGARPPVFPSLLEAGGTRAVLSRAQVGDRFCDVVAYFARPRPAGVPPFREWGTHRTRVLDGLAARWAPAPEADPPVAADLAPLLADGRLSWIEPFDPGATLRTGTDGCPWLA